MTKKTLFTLLLFAVGALALLNERFGKIESRVVRLDDVRSLCVNPGELIAMTEEKSERKPAYWRSTMMPNEISKTPGKDSMGMEMVPVYEDESASSSVIAIDPVVVQNMGIRLSKVTRAPLIKTIRTVGMITTNERTEAKVSTKVRGWVERLYVNTTGQSVEAGQLLMEVYSPELYAAQIELLLAKQPELQENAKTKLRFYDVPEEEIDALTSSGKIRKNLGIKAPRGGVVIEKKVVEGQMVEAEDPLFLLADVSTVWALIQVYERDLPFVNVGQSIKLTFPGLSGQVFEARINFIYPLVDTTTRTTNVRLELENPKLDLRPGGFVTATVDVEVAKEVLLVPESAIIRSGERNTAFVALGNGRFELRHLVLGRHSSEDAYEVLKGLNDGDFVVDSGQFLLDSESQLREAAKRFLEVK